MNKIVRQTTDNTFALQHSILNAISHNCILYYFNLYHLTGIHNYKKSKNKYAQIHFSANLVLNSSFVETHHPSPWLSNTLFERLFLPERVTNYKILSWSGLVISFFLVQYLCARWPNIMNKSKIIKIHQYIDLSPPRYI